MYEAKVHLPLSNKHFARRMLLHFAWASMIVLLSLGVGMLGYRYFERWSWLDAFLNSSMLLGGMGPLNPPQIDAGKIFAGLYALYAGLVFLILAGVIATPLLHRLLHKFHWDSDNDTQEQSSKHLR
jgi:predicted membrane-bound spermidine synthase